MLVLEMLKKLLRFSIFSNNATLPVDRRRENLTIIFDDSSFIFHYVVEFDTRNTI